MLDRKYCPANEHLTMQLASLVYHIETAANALCFFRDGEAAEVIGFRTNIDEQH